MTLSSNWLALQKKQNKTKKKVTKAKVEKPKPAKVLSAAESINKELKAKAAAALAGESLDSAAPRAASDLKEAKTRPTKGTSDIGKYLAIDCEFVGVGPEGKESALARVSIVNFHGHVVMDEFVKPKETVTDWRTWVSGIKPQHMNDAISFKEAQEKVDKLLKNRILVGHAVHHDLDALFLSHPRSMTRDTSRHVPFRKKYAKGKTPSLKKLAKEILGLDIQSGEHSSVEDARVTMLIYKSDKKEFEKARAHPNTK